ncbi:MAG: UvrD-helicase domain-containing protein [Clostridia bacterium]|nr:UvrD-helicase domain-containing protein [Clostridia bacterium]
MGLFDAIGTAFNKAKAAIPINVKLDSLRKYYRYLDSQFKTVDIIPDIPQEHSIVMRKMKDYENTFRTGRYDNEMSEYNRYAEAIKKHNEFASQVKVVINKFFEIYNTVISNPKNFNKDCIIENSKIVNQIRSKQYQNNENVVKFLSMYDDLDKNIDVIVRQYNNHPIAKQMLDLSGDYYIDETKANTISEKFNNLLPKSNEKTYYDFPTLERLKQKIASHNEEFINRHIKDAIFDDVNGLSLDEDQRKSILCEEKTNLVVAGAGSGKTLTICGKIKYLIGVLGIKPEEILLLSFSRSSAEDLDKKAKIVSPFVEAKTFHSLGLEILKKPEEKTFVVENQFSKIIEDFFEEELINRPDLLAKVVNYYGLYSASLDENKIYQSQGELFDALAKKDYWTLKEKLKNLSDNGKMTTLKQENVKSYEELVIANFYFLNGVEYEYEQPYIHKTDTAEYRQYRPDFYLPQYGFYHEHYAINKDGNAIQFGEEESKKYIEGMSWKRQTHQQYQTKCIETYSYQFSNSDFFTNFQKLLKENGVEFKPVSMEDVWCKLKGVLNKSDFSSFRALISTFVSLYKSRYKDDKAFNELKKVKFESDYECKRASHLLDICKEVYVYYKSRLQYETIEDEKPVQMIDFDDMILESVDSLKKMPDQFKYKYIIVDEFQDISYSRMLFLKSLVAHGNSKLFLVGDDWQSIYRFSGSDIDIFINAEKYFGKTAINFINATHRNSAELIEIAAPFITANKEQFKKNVKSQKHTESPIRLVCFDNDKISAFMETISKIYSESPKSSVLVLGRNNFDLESVLPSVGAYRDKDELHLRGFESLKITYKTVHSSKGLEADNVILINGDDAKLGFPNKIEDDKLLKLVLANKGEYPYAEERRLFYVAITRTKNVCYILVNVEKPSEFVKEIKRKCKYIKYYSPRVSDKIIECPVCKGKLVIRTNENNRKKFYGCTHYPLCRYTNNDIKAVEQNKRCPKCGDFISLKNNRYGGKFWGCHSYPKCDYTYNVPSNEYRHCR